MNLMRQMLAGVLCIVCERVFVWALIQTDMVTQHGERLRVVCTINSSLYERASRSHPGWNDMMPKRAHIHTQWWKQGTKRNAR
jgi:hypothetical protein